MERGEGGVGVDLTGGSIEDMESGGGHPEARCECGEPTPPTSIGFSRDRAS